MKFESTSPSVVRSIRQRELLNVWIRGFEKTGRAPLVNEFAPDRLEDELPDLGFFSVMSAADSWKIQIKKNGRRLASMYGGSGQGLFSTTMLDRKSRHWCFPHIGSVSSVLSQFSPVL